jgi:hypothetical protein
VVWLMKQPTLRAVSVTENHRLSPSRLMRQQRRHLKVSAMDIARGAAQHEFSLEPMRETAHYDQIRVSLSCMTVQRLARALRQIVLSSSITDTIVTSRARTRSGRASCTARAAARVALQAMTILSLANSPTPCGTQYQRPAATEQCTSRENIRSLLPAFSLGFRR